MKFERENIISMRRILVVACTRHEYRKITIQTGFLEIHLIIILNYKELQVRGIILKNINYKLINFLEMFLEI